MKRPLAPAGAQLRADLLAWSLCVCCVALTAVGLVFFALNFHTDAPVSFGSRDAIVVVALIFLTLPLVGALIVQRQPGNPLGWLFSAIGVTMAGWVAADGYAIYGLLTHPGELPAARYVALLANEIWAPGWAMTGLVFLLFPTGRLPSARWKPVVWYAPICTLLAVLGMTVALGGPRDYRYIDNPLGIAALPFNGWDAGVTAVVVLLPLGVAAMSSLIVRFRGARGEVRQQLKWLTWSGAIVVVMISVWIILAPLGYRNTWIELASELTVVFIPISAGLAVLKYRLYDIDLIINRTLVYGTLSALLGGVYVGCVVLTQQIVDPFTQGSNLAIATSTLLVAGLFQPAQRRVQATVDYRFYRRKYDAQRTLEVFRTRVRQQTDLDAVSAELVAVIHETMQPEHVTLWLRS